MEKWLDNNGLADLHRAGFATDRLQKPVELSIDLRVEHALSHLRLDGMTDPLILHAAFAEHAQRVPSEAETPWCQRWCQLLRLSRALTSGPATELVENTTASAGRRWPCRITNRELYH